MTNSNLDSKIANEVKAYIQDLCFFSDGMDYNSIAQIFIKLGHTETIAEKLGADREDVFWEFSTNCKRIVEAYQ